MEVEHYQRVGDLLDGDSSSHCIGWSLGKEHDTNRILQRDIAMFCRACEICQKTSSRGVTRAPFKCLPIISQLFERIAMGIIGPLPKSSKCNRFVIVICDNGTID